ncbi:GrpB family protein [Propionibacteriaceae bacterium Y1685]
MTVLVDHDPGWSAEFARAAQHLLSAADRTWTVEHIGSTSVPGLMAKPIIDLAVRVGSVAEVDDMRAQLSRAGWLAVRRQPVDHRVLVREANEVRTHIAHFFTAQQWETCHQRLFRDWLRAHPEDQRVYLEAKRRASGEIGGAYTRIKAPVVLEIVNRAREAQGLPPLADLDSGSA